MKKSIFVRDFFTVLSFGSLLLGCDDAPELKCASVSESSFFVHFDPSLDTGESDAERFSSFPWPSDHRLSDNGHFNGRDFPDPNDALGIWTDAASKLIKGFGLNSPSYLRFNRALDLSALDDVGASFLEANSPIQLVNVSAGSPRFGERLPLQWEYRSADGLFTSQNSLALAPVWGFPMEQSAHYALILTSDLTSTDGEALQSSTGVQELLQTEYNRRCLNDDEDKAFSALRNTYAPLRDWLDTVDIDREKVAVATVFTTQDITSEMQTIYEQIQATPAPPFDASRLKMLGETELWRDRAFQHSSTQTTNYHEYEGHYDAPNYQEGTIPYATRGGTIYTVDGEPTPFMSESVRYTLTIPASPPMTSSGCYPIVQYAHGTGGESPSLAITRAGRLSSENIAMIGIDQPIHGARGVDNPSYPNVDIILHSFNYFNPESGRSMFRQGAIDTFSLTRFIKDSLRIPASHSPTGEDICFETENLSYFGHSQGGVTGSIALPFEKNIKNWVLSGAGGGLGITLIEGNENIDIAAIISLLAGLQPEEPISELHPIVALLQTLVEVSDPINYAPYWALDNRHRSPPHIFMTSGVLDDITPPRTAGVLAHAADLDVVGSLSLPIRAYSIDGRKGISAPVHKNRFGQTYGFAQWGDDGSDEDYSNHFVIFHRPEAINASTQFLAEAVYNDAPRILLDSTADVR